MRSIADLKACISQLENQYINNPSSIILKEYLLLKAVFDTLSTVTTEEMLIKSRHAYYEANRLLAHQLRQSSASRIIPAIKTHNILLSDHHEINNSSLEFYNYCILRNKPLITRTFIIFSKISHCLTSVPMLCNF